MITSETTIHVVPDQLGADSIKAAYALPAQNLLVPWDCVSYGPAPLLSRLEEWRKLREQFGLSLRIDVEDLYSEGRRYDDVLENFSRLRDASSIVVWLGESTPDQMFSAWLVYYLKATGIDLGKLHFVTFDKGSWQNIFSAGELSPEEILERASAPTSPGVARLEELDHVWRCYTASNHRQLATYVSSHQGSLRDAVAPILERYPDEASGLGCWERLLLENTRKYGPRLVRVVGRTLLPDPEEMHLDTLQTHFILDKVMRMTPMGVRNPLIQAQWQREKILESSVALTSEGEAVLAGVQSAIQLNGIDEWIGGVHLTLDNIVFRNAFLSA